MKIYCIHCGTQLPDSASFCLKCGISLKDIAALASPQPEPKWETYEQEVKESDYSIKRTDHKPEDHILYPRILFALCVVLLSIALFIGQSNTPSNGTPLAVANPTLAHTLGVIGVVGLLLLFIVWIWCLYLTYQRHQSGWRTALWFTVFSAAIPILLYLLINPQDKQET